MRVTTYGPTQPRAGGRSDADEAALDEVFPAEDGQG